MRQHTNLLAGVTIVSFLALFCYALVQLSYIDRGLRREIGESNLWFSSTANYEAQRLGLALVTAEADRDIDAALFRLDILYSRVALMLDPRQIVYFRVMGLEDQLITARDLLDELDEIMSSDSFGLTNVDAALTKLEEVQKVLHHFANEVSLAERTLRFERRENELRAMRLLLTAVAGVFMAGLVMAAQLWRSVKRAHKAQAQLQAHRNRLEDEVAERTRELQAALSLERRAKDIYRSFVITVSHQFRTPISIIDMIARRQARNVGDEAPELKRKFQRIVEATERLEAIISGFLSTASLEGDSSRLNAERVDLTTLLDHVRDQAAKVYVGRTLLIENSLPANFSIEGDENLLRQSIFNLASNALNYSQPLSVVEIFTALVDKTVEIRVRDQGIGIPPEAQASIFEPYYRAPNVHRIPGVGVGLSLSRDIIVLHGGEITFSSEEGKGSEFVVRLPATGET